MDWNIINILYGLEDHLFINLIYSAETLSFRDLYAF